MRESILQLLGRFGARVPNIIYKICEVMLWREAERDGAFRGATVDARDGFIHFSTAAQVRETAARHFAGMANLMLIAVDAVALGGVLKWEASRGGDLFPHLYGPLPMAAVLWVIAILSNWTVVHRMIYTWQEAKRLEDAQLRSVKERIEQ